MATNRWLNRTGYVPIGGTSYSPIISGTSGHRVPSGSGTTPPPVIPAPPALFASSGPARTHSFGTLLAMCANAVTVGTSLLVVAALSILNHATFTRLEPVQPEETRPFESIKLERARTVGAAHWVLSKNPTASGELFIDWNGGENQIGTEHYVHGARLSRGAALYIPVPRSGWERYFERMQHKSGLSGIQLHEIWPPASWSREFFDAVKFKWAARCGVKAELIDEWSTFRSSDSPWLGKFWRQLPSPFSVAGSTDLKNECQRGGVCFLITTGCRSGAFSDFQSAGATD